VEAAVGKARTGSPQVTLLNIRDYPVAQAALVQAQALQGRMVQPAVHPEPAPARYTQAPAVLAVRSVTLAVAVAGLLHTLSEQRAAAARRVTTSSEMPTSLGLVQDRNRATLLNLLEQQWLSHTK
jgi:hypothetical protein